jgi:hypothetical protein
MFLFHMAMVSWVFQCRRSVSSSIGLGLLPAEKCAILTDMTQVAVLLHQSISSTELPNLNPLRLGFKTWGVVVNIIIKRSGTAEKGVVQVELAKKRTNFTHRKVERNRRIKKRKEERKDEERKEREEKRQYVTNCYLVDLRKCLLYSLKWNSCNALKPKICLYII